MARQKRYLINMDTLFPLFPVLVLFFTHFIGNKFFQLEANFVMSKVSSSDIGIFSNWVKKGKVRSIIGSTIDSTFPLEDIVKAHERIESHRTQGKIILDMKR